MKIHKSILWLNSVVCMVQLVNIYLIYFMSNKFYALTLNLLGIIIILGSVYLQIGLIRKFKMKLSEQINRFMGITESLNEGTNNLSKRTSDQAASLEETASTMEEITATVKQNGEHSKLAVNLTNEALDVAQQGTHLSREVQGAMDEISQSSNKISDIVGLVEEIAFQTNILAINAAIEAAKAGDIGKGFAVVAIEVRELAQLSSNAAKEIKNLIDNSIAKVEKGSGLVVLSNQNLLGIAEGIQKVADIMGDVSSATNEQFTAIDQISDTVTQLDTATQDNTTLVDSLTNSSDQLKNIVSGLNLVVAGFLPDDQASSRRGKIPLAKLPPKQDSKQNDHKLQNQVSSPAKAKVVPTAVTKVEVKTTAIKPALTSVKKIGIKKPEIKKPIAKKPEIKKPEVKKLESSKPEVIAKEQKTLEPSDNKPEALVDHPPRKKEKEKPVKKVQSENSDDIVESILSRDPNFFDSGEDF